MFPFSATCAAATKTLTAAEQTAALVFLKTFAEKHKATEVLLTDQAVRFKMSLIGSRGDLFSGITNGVFILSAEKIRFHFQMYGLLLALVPAVICMIMLKNYLNVTVIATIIMCGNWFLARYSYRQLTKKLAEQINLL